MLSSPILQNYHIPDSGIRQADFYHKQINLGKGYKLLICVGKYFPKLFRLKKQDASLVSTNSASNH